jgi:hypothetical protein
MVATTHNRRPSNEDRTLRFTFHGKEIRLPEEPRPFVLGRDVTADLVVPDRMASRAHCEVERRQDKYVLVDRSANGTFLTVVGDREIVLRREEAILRGHGFIALGQSRDTSTEVVEFHCD